jgi:hypothetical protein
MEEGKQEQILKNSRELNATAGGEEASSEASRVGNWTGALKFSSLMLVL